MEKFDFTFYLKFAKPLILNLPNTTDRILAAAWIKRLTGDTSVEESVRFACLKLFLFVLQRGRLAPPFNDHPGNVNLEAIAKDKTLIDVAKGVIEDEQQMKRQENFKRLKGDPEKFPPYISDFSADLLEYVAVQCIDNFGVHGYYAISKEPLNTWLRVEREQLPKAAKSMLEVSPPPPTFLDSHSTPQLPDKSPPKEPKSPEPEPPVEMPPSESPGAHPSPGGLESPGKSPKKTPRKSTLGAKPPSRPLGTVSPPSDERHSPTWGSNLLEAKYLDEEVGDMVREATNLDQFVPDPESTDVVAAPMQVLYQGGAVPPPLTRRVKPGPLPKQTRASMLLQKKKQQELAPAPPPKAKKEWARRPPKIVPRGLSSKTNVAAAAAPPPSLPVTAPSRERIKGKKVAKKIDLEVGSPAPREDFRGFGPEDEVDQWVRGYNRELKKMRKDYSRQLSRFERTQRDESVAVGGGGEVSQRVPSRHLSRLAKLSGQTIPRAHDAAVALEKSIHMSPEARQFLDGIVDGPSTSTGIQHPQMGSVRYPAPRMPHRYEQEEYEDEDEAHYQEPNDIDAFELGNLYPEYASTHGVPHKDPRLVQVYNDALNTSLEMRSDLGNFNMDDMEMDFGNISGGDLGHGMEGLQAPETEEDDDDFEAMERQIEAQMVTEGLDPHERLAIGYDDFEGWERMDELQEKIDSQQQHLEKAGKGPHYEGPHYQEPYDGAAYDEGEWTEGPHYFEAQNQKYADQLTTAERMHDVFPGMEMGEFEDEEFDLDAEILPFDNYVQQQEDDKQLEILKETYQDYYDHDPAMSGVGVTVPRPTVSPGARPKKTPVKYTVDYPPSPPHFPEESIAIPTDIDEVVSKHPPESYQFQYDSPQIKYHEMKKVPTVDVGGISPENKLLWTDMKALERKMHGAPQKTVPDLFDLPQPQRLHAESPPQFWAPGASIEESPIDARKLKALARKKAKKPGRGKPYRRRFPKGYVVQRYTQGTPMAREMIPEVEEPPHYFTWEDEDVRDKIAEHEHIYDQRRMQFPYAKVRSLRGQRQPGLGRVREEYESPERRGPDIFDEVGRSPWTPTVATEDLPAGFASPVSPYFPELDSGIIALDAMGGARKPTYGPVTHYGPEGMPPMGPVKTRGRVAKLGPVLESMEDMDESEWGNLGNITAASSRMPPRTFARPSRPPTLEPLTRSPIEYPPSPVARAPAPASPGGRLGPQRRSLRKKLKQRRLDFLEEPTDETQTEVMEVEADVADRDLTPEWPDIQSPRLEYDLPPHGNYGDDTTYGGSPRTPRRETGFMEEGFPEVEGLPEFAPTSPMSEYGVLEGVMEEVRGHVPEPPRVPRGYVNLKNRWKQRPGRRLKKVTEKHGAEEVYRIREEVEDELEANYAAEAAARQRALEASVIDQPVPGGLASPMRPPVAVPFYETPPHMKLAPYQRRQHDPSVARMANLLFGTAASAQMDLEERDEQAELDRFELMEHAANLEESPQRTPRNLQMLPPGARHQALRAAQAQYDQLRTPPKTVEQFYNEIMAMPASPGFYRQREEHRLAEEAAAQRAEQELEYQQTIREREPAPVPVKKPSKWARAPKLAPRQLKKKTPKVAEPPQPPPKGKPVAKGKSDQSLKSSASGASVRSAGSKQSVTKRKVREPAFKRKPLYEAPPNKPRQDGKLIKAVKSDKSIKSATSGASVKSTASSQNFMPKINKKYNVPSKLNTGLKRKPKAPKKGPTPPMEVEYEKAALQELGLTEGDIENMNLMEVGPASQSIESLAAQCDAAFAKYDTPPTVTTSNVEAHSRYDRRNREAVKTLKIRGRILPMRGELPPGVEMIGDEEGADSPEFIPPHLVKRQAREQEEAAIAFRHKYAEELGLDEEEGSPDIGATSRGFFDDGLPEMGAADMDFLYDDESGWGNIIMDVVPAAGPLLDEEKEALEISQAAIGGASWGGADRMPEHLENFSWMSPTKIHDNKMPWDEG